MGDSSEHMRCRESCGLAAGLACSSCMDTRPRLHQLQAQQDGPIQRLQGWAASCFHAVWLFADAEAKLTTAIL